MNIFQKLKVGAAKAADKAQKTVEMTKISAQISGKRKEMERNFTAIGSAVYHAYQSADLSLAEPEIVRLSQENEAIEREIADLQLKLKHLKDEKVCVCGKSVSSDAVFCPNCGRKFEAEPEPITVMAEAAVGEERNEAMEMDAELELEDPYAPEHAAPASPAHQAAASDKDLCRLCKEEMRPDETVCFRCGAPRIPSGHQAW